MSIILGLTALALCLPTHQAPAPKPAAVAHHNNDDTLTHQAGALFVANSAYAEACKTSDPAAALDDMCDHLPDVMPDVFTSMGTTPGLAELLLPAIANRLWAFAVVEHARSEGGDDYGYAFTVLADALKNGADPQTIRAEVPRVLQRVRAADIVNRIWQARDAAEGPWAEILDIVLAAIDEGADPGAVCERTLALFEQVRAESAGGAR